MSEPEKIFSNYLERNGLKLTEKRWAILRAFDDSTGHVSAEEIYNRVRNSGVKIGIAAVWRTMRLIQKAGLADEHFFGKAGIRYEKRASGRHAHMVCTGCGSACDFDLGEILPVLKQHSRRFGFHMGSCELSLFGLCQSCRKGGTSADANTQQGGKECVEVMQS